MKNKFIKIFVVILCLFGLTSCTTSFCSDEDVASIKAGLLAQLDNNTGTGDYARPDDSMWETSKVDFDVSGRPEGVDIWDYLDTLGEDGQSAQNSYVDYIYTNYHPKACLVTEDHEDKASGATISGKTFSFAFEQGLLEMLAFPMSFLFVKGAQILGNGTVSGVSIFLSIVIVTFLLRFIIALLTMKSTKQQQLIQVMQPEVEAINRKYENKFDEKSKQMKSMEIMKLYKKYNVNPMSSLITPFITLPVFIAVYSAVKDSTIIYEGSFGGLEFGDKLGSSILNGSWLAIAIFVLMALSQFVTMRLSAWLNKKHQKAYKIEKQKGPSQSDMMSYMFLAMILFIGWVLPVALSIYWISSSLYSIVQTFVLDYFNHKKGSN